MAGKGGQCVDALQDNADAKAPSASGILFASSSMAEGVGRTELIAPSWPRAFRAFIMAKLCTSSLGCLPPHPPPRRSAGRWARRGCVHRPHPAHNWLPIGGSVARDGRRREQCVTPPPTCRRVMECDGATRATTACAAARVGVQAPVVATRGGGGHLRGSGRRRHLERLASARSP